ncbi:putative membrane protein [Halodesulfurarchaeum formicicum]|uniref:Putative membrane protein n=1 Tax=Halodesulfurarchaeum formicicum TaxID=1873524 RepID=A0A1J1AFB1_9EURY|nr:putative membrane protein [Halodesulfurarchaeum formicicum]
MVGGSATGGQFYAVRWSNTETVEDLGTLRANDAGTIVGTNTVRGPTAGVHAVRWIDDAVEKLGSLAGSDGDSYATDINTQGEIAGSSDRSGEGRTAVVWNR